MPKSYLRSWTFPNWEELTKSCADAVRRFVSFLALGKLRFLCAHREMPWMVFTDASYEPTDRVWPAGLGAIAHDPMGRALEYYSLSLTHGQLELMAACVAFATWENMFQGAPVILFIDNNSCRDVVISGAARSRMGQCLVRDLFETED